MPTGLFRTTDQSVQVEYDKVSIPIPRRHIRRTAISRISTNYPSKKNIGPHRRSWLMPKGPKGPTPSRRIDQVRPQQLNAKWRRRIDLG